jgi:tRNA modification GTPase
MIPDTEDTIAGIATGPSRSALGIIRLSGRKSRDIAAATFRPRSGGEIEPGRARLGFICEEGGRVLDEVMLVLYASPHSYTGEDLLEISCHGNPLILRAVLRLICAHGARVAAPGEFTFRAFLNGRLDLVQAEAVNRLVRADSLCQSDLALSQLQGGLSKDLSRLKARLLELTALMEGNIDFSEEQQYRFVDEAGALEGLEEVEEGLSGLIGTYERGRLIEQGVSAVIVGLPNAGKSSVFNRILGTDRAIVAREPGTTRDFLRERVSLGGYAVNLYDTAGVREESEGIEREGVRRTRELVARADLVIVVVDGASSECAEEDAVLKEAEGRERVVVCNKADLPGYRERVIGERLGVRASAVTGEGISELLSRVEDWVSAKAAFASGDSLVSEVRHVRALERALESVGNARRGISAGVSEEYSVQDLRDALSALGEITGEVMVEDLYDFIFNSFCIGK